MNKKIKIGTLYLILLGAFLFALLMLSKIIPYLSFERYTDFLGTKMDEVLDNSLFNWAFYVHITSSFFVMIAGVFQFIPPFIRKTSFHRSIGKVYMVGILILAAPSGLILGYFANGGLPCKIAFCLQSFIWWICTAIALNSVKKKDFLSHTQWIFRSYAVTLAAMSLRVDSYIMTYVFHTKPLETYLTVTWLSWVGNLFLAEILIYFGMGQFLLKSLKK
ncbi:MAG: DUF2306 domain-containing protein [Chitinophagales bacterium]|nr:DUF2306 domain-containing protein [Chitinophagales bacterium]